MWQSIPALAVALIITVTGCDLGREMSPGQGGPQFKLTDFQSARSCSTCHPQYYDEWSGSMHHYATNDPIWMLSINKLQQSTGGRLNDWCWQCHSPIAFLTGTAQPVFRLEDLPDIVREGVNCDVCHTMRPPHTSTNQIVRYNIKPGRTKYGPIADPVPSGFHDTAYDPSFSRSEKCRECHDLIANNVPVEITFTEWQNSAWGAMSVECQDCHMSRYRGQAAVGGPVRDNLHRHDFVGVDVAITDFPNKPAQRAMVDSLLKNAACMTVLAPQYAELNDSIRVEVRVCNDKTGHNLPTSVFFNRQMWIEVTVWDGIGHGFETGHLDANGDLKDRNSDLEPGADPYLVLFGGTLYKNGVETNVFELDSLVNNSIPPFETRSGHFRFRLPRAGIWNLKVRLLFRPFGPYLFRALGAEQHIAELPIFEMRSYEGIINVQ